jgi:glycine/D-amino acid oxidase-like deaminating enzyme
MNYEYLIIGQGIAGTMLAEELSSRGASFLVMDHYHQDSSSHIAAGLINPITGKRFVKSWNLEQFLSIALSKYRELELKYDINFIFKSDILRILDNQKQENDLILRSEDPAYHEYLSINANITPDFIKHSHNTAWIKNAWRIEMSSLLDSGRLYLNNNNLLLEEKFDYNKLLIEGSRFIYKEMTFQKVIFCEGYRAVYNPWFKYLPFEPDKGELLIIRIPGFIANYTIKRQIAIIHLKEDIYWVGATNEWEFPDDQPTAKMKDWLIQHLNATLNFPYEILEHKAAIRPTVRDRRPFLGEHPEIPGLFILNGLGTKGALLAPWCALQMADLLIKDIPIETEVSIKRFDLVPPAKAGGN